MISVAVVTDKVKVVLTIPKEGPNKVLAVVGVLSVVTGVGVKARADVVVDS